MNSQQLMFAVGVSVSMLLVLHQTCVTVTEQLTFDAPSPSKHFDG
jgi:hypothetical protein